MEKNLTEIIFEVLQSRPFCNCAIKEEDLYSAYCGRVAETVEMKLEVRDEN